MKVSVIFTEDFATKKKGETMLVDGMLANQLVNHDKVAEFSEKAEKEVKQPKEPKKAKEPKETKE